MKTIILMMTIAITAAASPCDQQTVTLQKRNPDGTITIVQKSVIGTDGVVYKMTKTGENASIICPDGTKYTPAKSKKHGKAPKRKKHR